jgi:hypothetical protein
LASLGVSYEVAIRWQLSRNHLKTTRALEKWAFSSCVSGLLVPHCLSSWVAELLALWLRASKNTKVEAAGFYAWNPHTIAAPALCWLKQVARPAQNQCMRGRKGREYWKVWFFGDQQF